MTIFGIFIKSSVLMSIISIIKKVIRDKKVISDKKVVGDNSVK